MADTHDVWVVGAGVMTSERLAAACPPGRSWPDRGPVPARVEVLLHCADTYVEGPLQDTAVDTWRDLFQANLFDFAELTSILLPALRATRGHVIVINSSGIADRPEGRAAYAGSKAALAALTEVLRTEEEQHGVRVTVIDPGQDATVGVLAADLAEAIAGAVRSLALPR
ncbi:SDR family NAD(P)-dependent oxidoreductase [Amycolatopsis sp. NPDC006131]|uniref:SDR family NAD(P)-dependent oxidoreductase n=1 Tax=Amycolatopsis sp. NPDC006131 TaxID=3156731 RepID=UPI0033B7430D